MSKQFCILLERKDIELPILVNVAISDWPTAKRIIGSENSASHNRIKNIVFLRERFGKR
jgi:hypothetical protein